MFKPEAGDSEFEAGHQERLTSTTLERITGLTEDLIVRHGDERDTGLAALPRDMRSPFLKLYEAWGITEETPVVRQLTANIKDARALPAYLKTGESPQAVALIRPLIAQLLFKFKICYGERSKLSERWFLEGIEIDILSDDPADARVFERDPSTGEYLIRPLTEGRGKDVILDLEEVLAELG